MPMVTCSQLYAALCYVPLFTSFAARNRSSSYLFIFNKNMKGLKKTISPEILLLISVSLWSFWFFANSFFPLCYAQSLLFSHSLLSSLFFSHSHPFYITLWSFTFPHTHALCMVIPWPAHLHALLPSLRFSFSFLYLCGGKSSGDEARASVTGCQDIKQCFSSKCCPSKETLLFGRVSFSSPWTQSLMVRGQLNSSK